MGEYADAAIERMIEGHMRIGNPRHRRRRRSKKNGAPPPACADDFDDLDALPKEPISD